MATKSKAPAKTAGATRNVSKGAAKAAGKAKPKTAGKPATAAARKTAGKPAAKPAGTKKAPGAVSPVSKAAKTVGKTPAQKISPAKAASAGPGKSVSAKTAAAGSAAAKTNPRSATGPASPTLLAGSATIASLLVLDGAGTDTIIAEGLGSRRYEVTVRGLGGHSWSDFGVANPIVALARVIDRFSRTPVPVSPKTTYNIGIINGGTSVNSIPESATMRVDTRSASVEELDRLERALHEAVDHVIPEITARKKQELLTAEVRVIGNRPAADLPTESQLLKAIRAVDAQLGNTARIQRASTDANIPLSLGREAIAIGAGGSGGGAHTIHEWYDPTGRDLGLKRILLLTLTLAGVADE